MHDLDRTLSTLDPEASFEAEFDDEADDGFVDELLGEGFGLEPEADELEALRSGLPFGEDEEIELATELLAVQDEDELEMFVEGLLDRLRKRFKRFGKSKVGKLLKPFIKKFAGKVLPIAGSALGGYIGGPAGAAIGGQLADRAGRYFGLELEGLAPEDQELEVARRVVRFAGLAAANAARIPAGVDDENAWRRSLAVAARRTAPGLLRASGHRPRWGSPGRRPRWGARRRSRGRWVRRGPAILVIGA